MEKSTDFLKSTALLLVDNPNAVTVERKLDDRGTLLTLMVDQKDIGKVLGKQGNTANSLRVLLRAIGARENERVSLKVHDPEKDGKNDLKVD